MSIEKIVQSNILNDNIYQENIYTLSIRKSDDSPPCSGN